MDSDHSTDDFEYARRIYHDILVKGSEAMDDMMDVAKSTEHPRAFEVLSTMMKTLADVNNNLIDLHKKKKDFNKTDAPLAIPGSTTNNVFVGSTADLQKMLIDQIKDITPSDQ